MKTKQINRPTKAIILSTLSTFCLGLLLVSAPKVHAAKVAEPSKSDSSEGGSLFVGPAIHLSLGIRAKKAPDLDTFHTALYGVKFSLFGLQMGQNLYLSLGAVGLQYSGREAIFVPSLTPVMFNSMFGVGLGIDFFPVRKDRPGGPVGMSLNLDVVRLYQYAQGFIQK